MLSGHPALRVQGVFFWCSRKFQIFCEHLAASCHYYIGGEIQSMAKWYFWKPIEDMNFQELADELVDIVSLCEDHDIDVDAITQVLDVIDEKYPLNVEFRPVDEMWVEFCEQYINKSL